MKSFNAAIMNFLVFVIALAFAAYSSLISKELLADIYSPPASPIEPVHEDLGHATSDRLHQEKIITRTVKCITGCTDSGQWGAFASYAGSKEKVDADGKPGETPGKSKINTLTVGIDKVLGAHLIGLALGTSNGEADVVSEVEIDPGFEPELRYAHLDRDKQSIGMYYGMTLPYYVNLTAQFLVSDYDYKAAYFSESSYPQQADDNARFDGNGYSTAFGGTAIVPLKAGDFDFLFQPSIRYSYAKTKTDSFVSESGDSFSKSELNSGEWQFAMKWRVPIILKEVFLFPFGGISYSILDRKVKRLDETTRRDFDLIEAVVGLTVQKNSFNFSATYSNTVHDNGYERELYRVTFRIVF